MNDTTQVGIIDKFFLGSQWLGLKYVQIASAEKDEFPEVQHVFDFLLLKCTFRIDWGWSNTEFTIGVYKVYIKFGIGISG